MKTVILHEQSVEFKQALMEGDLYKAHLFFMPPTYLPLKMIKSQIKTKELFDSFNEEQKRIEGMSPELLRIEIEMKLSKKK